MNRKVIFLRSNPIAPDPRVEKEARALTSAGFEVTVVGWDRSASLPVHENRDGYIIHRLLIRSNYGKGLGNLPQVLRWQVGLLHWLVRHHNNYDFIHACDFDTILPALWCKWLYRKKVVYDIFDFYADHLRNTPGFIKVLIRRVDFWAISKADAVILVDESRRKQIAKSHYKNLVVIYNSPEENSHSKPGDSSTGFTISYVGLLQLERGIIELLDVLSRHPEWRLEIAGFGGDEDLIKQKAQSLPNVHWHGRVDYEAAMALNLKGTTLIATYDPSIPNHRFSSPNKVFEAMMLGKPIVVAKNTNMDEIIQQANCGIVISYGNENELEAALTQLSSDPETCQKLGANGRHAYETRYSWTIMSSRLVNLYKNLENGTR